MGNYQFITETGVIVPDTADLLLEVQTEWKAALGADLQVTSDTPQGVMIAGETSARAAVAANNAQLANQINPNLAGGVFLDAICALLGLERAIATRTLVRDVTVAGQPSTNVPAGTRAATAAGDLFETVGGVVLDAGGNGSVNFQSVEFGPIPCAAAALNVVIDSVLGWETVTNPTEGVLGTAEQSDESLRDLRRRTLARQGISVNEAITSDVQAVEGVKSMQYRENIAPTTQVIDGISLVAHSVWACVDGGSDEDVALALLQNKTCGAAWNGSESVPVVDEYSGQTYTVLFDRPTNVPMLIRVTVRVGNYLGDPQADVKAAVLAYAEGEIPGERGFVVGASVSPFEIAGGVSYFAPGLFVTLVEVATVAGAVYQSTEYALALDEVASTASGYITVVTV